MIVGVPAEVKPGEQRVALTPTGAAGLVARRHRVLVEHDAGSAAGFRDEAYVAAGSEVADAERVWSESELLVKVKEPIPAEYRFLRHELTIFTYLHLAADRDLAEALLRTGATAIAYETVQDPDGTLPLLSPMSEVAGRLAAQLGAHHLLRPFGGPGRLIGGVAGVERCKVVVLGGGTVGTQAARVAAGMGAEVVVLERSLSRIRELDDLLPGSARAVYSDSATLSAELAGAALVIGAVLVPGAAAPKLVSSADLGLLVEGCVLVDVAIDQGGCFATSRPTTYEEPTFELEGILHHCVANLPAAVPVTATRALTNATFPYLLALAERGPEQALEADPTLARGLNVRDGKIEHAGVAAGLAA